MILRGGGNNSIQFVAGCNWTASISGDNNTWCHLSETSGKIGTRTITITADPNVYPTVRTATITISGEEAEPIVIEISQAAAAKTDDGKEIGHVYMSDGFDWIPGVLEAGDYKSGKGCYDSNQLLPLVTPYFTQYGYAAGGTKVNCYMDFTDDNSSLRFIPSMWLQWNMAPHIEAGHTSNIRLTFRVKPAIGAKFDKVILYARIISGETAVFASADPNNPKESQRFDVNTATGNQEIWTESGFIAIDIYDVDHDTVIDIRPNSETKSRYSMDDLKIEKIASRQ